jgi:hypothetical protein
MWEMLKKAFAGVADAIGVEIPGLPVDLGAVGDAATTAVQGFTESTTGVVEAATSATDAIGIEIPGLPVDLGAVGDAATTAVQGLTESATGVVEASTGATDAISATTIGEFRRSSGR